jgi:hypothetical protein
MTRSLGPQSRRGARRLDWLATVLIAVSAPAGALDGGGCVVRLARNTLAGDVIGLVPVAPFPPELLDEAIRGWRGCPGYATEFPRFVIGPATRTLTIRHHPGSSGASRCGRLSGNTVSIYTWARGVDGKPVRCAPLALILAHELGHALGLDDAPDDPACRSIIMAQVDPRDPEARAVGGQECAAVARLWRTGGEERSEAPAQRQGLASLRSNGS